jgi:SAM-dependent methyltransferase
MRDPRKQAVVRGYNEIADRFLDWAGRIEDDPRTRFRGELFQRLPEGAHLLDLGCGAGVPDTAALAERFRVTGVDISWQQIRRARANVPRAFFRVADFTEMSSQPEIWDAVTAFYSFNHVPRELLGPLIARIHGWLRDGGYLLAALGCGDIADWTGDWLGTTMYFSSWDAETNRRLLRGAGFRLELDEVVSLHEPEGDAPFHWVLGQR